MRTDLNTARTGGESERVPEHARARERNAEPRWGTCPRSDVGDTRSADACARSRECEIRDCVSARRDDDPQRYHGFLGRLTGQLRARLGRRFAVVGYGPTEAQNLLHHVLMAIISVATPAPLQPFMPWLHAVARYKFLDYIRRTKSWWVESAEWPTVTHIRPKAVSPPMTTASTIGRSNCPCLTGPRSEFKSSHRSRSNWFSARRRLRSKWQHAGKRFDAVAPAPTSLHSKCISAAGSHPPGGHRVRSALDM